MIDYQALAETANPEPAHKVPSEPEVKSWKQKWPAVVQGEPTTFAVQLNFSAVGSSEGTIGVRMPSAAPELMRPLPGGGPPPLP
jgi:hypothetical protein